MSLVDSHCHLDDERFDGDREGAIERALAAGIETLLCIGTGDGPPDLEAAIRLADAHESVLATVGIHPQHAAKATPENYTHLAELLQHPKCVGVGEVGLDYHWEPYDKAVQEAVFRTQLAIAADAGKPVIVHTRDAWEDTLRILKDYSGQCLLHCFSGGPQEAQQALELGFYLSFSGVVTYPKATEVQAAAAMTPIDRLLVETDAPYLPPVPHRGQRNEPAYVVHTANRVAELRGITAATLGRAVCSNFNVLFGLTKTDQLH